MHLICTLICTEKYPTEKYLRKIAREQAKPETKQDKNNANDKKLFENAHGHVIIAIVFYNPIKDNEKLVLTAINIGATAMNKTSESELKEAIMGFVSEYGIRYAGTYDSTSHYTGLYYI